MEFEPGTKRATIDSCVITLRNHAAVVQVERLSSSEVAAIPRRPTPDGLADTTVRDGLALFKLGCGAVLEQLTEAERDVADLLVHHVRADLGAIKDAKALLKELQAFRPERWTTKKAPSSATDAYASLRQKLATTGYDLVELPIGTYAFQWYFEGKSPPPGSTPGLGPGQLPQDEA